MKSEIVIVDALRTPIGRFGGRLAQFSATELGAQAIGALLKRNGLQGDEPDEVILGNVLQGGEGQAPARQAAIRGGVSPAVPALTVNKVCGSGLKAVLLAAQALKAGDARLLIAGGMEAMSNAPYLLYGARRGFKYGDRKLVDMLIHDGLWCSFAGQHMGNSAEYTAEKSGISREDQDRYAYQSHMKAVRAAREGRFAHELIPLQGKDGPIEADETPRPDTSLEKLAQLRPAFVAQGTVTAGNAPGLNDGAAVLLLSTQEEAAKRGWQPLAIISDYAISGTEPLELFYAPIYSTRHLLAKMNVEINYFDLIEANEAFAAQTLADGRELEWDWERVNVNGGAIALGHPLGASGARILATLVWAMHDREAQTGLATICMGGGNGISLAVRRAA
ncbi:MAG TPA: acetyl-CoA C-acetyltransferase [Candidatus Fraserbacteria bacterium]|nr:acetyl-CoA C-acetyltransferase [Candidatus Fraserbacteria bacterium]